MSSQRLRLLKRSRICFEALLIGVLIAEYGNELSISVGLCKACLLYTSQKASKRLWRGLLSAKEAEKEKDENGSGKRIVKRAGRGVSVSYTHLDVYKRQSFKVSSTLPRVSEFIL